MKAAERTEIQNYLAAVEREASALAPERRQELRADLAEHIEAALDERPDAVEEVLRELGDPRTIVATVLRETGAPSGAAEEPDADAIPATPATPTTPEAPENPAPGKDAGTSPAAASQVAGSVAGPAAGPTAGSKDGREIPPLAVVLALALAFPLAIVWVPLGALARLAGLVLLWVSPRWATWQKAVGTLLTFVGPVVLAMLAYFVDPGGLTPQRLLATAELAFPVLGAIWLWRARR
ncbi:hypothetical protein [Streptomyces sp. AJS327]|uniref:HAAS signaling domain-containing protein n=1 Tax=Streptomyces sp. AJS327 TaxID=2545265 RepID=UPI0015DDE6B9|nr:hypothetical protein [Streptomyces sp. AJS327]